MKPLSNKWKTKRSLIKQNTELANGLVFRLNDFGNFLLLNGGVLRSTNQIAFLVDEYLTKNKIHPLKLK